MDIKRESELVDAAGIHYLNKDNCEFERTGDFVGATLRKEPKLHYNRVKLHRLFPFDMPYKYISILDEEDNELGIVLDVSEFDEETVALLKSELDRKYYVCKLKEILTVKDRFGFSHWKALSSNGEVTFTIRDAHNSIRQNHDGRIFLTDIDSNRYELDPFEMLSKKTKKRIELYL